MALAMPTPSRSPSSLRRRRACSSPAERSLHRIPRRSPGRRRRGACRAPTPGRPPPPPRPARRARARPRAPRASRAAGSGPPPARRPRGWRRRACARARRRRRCAPRYTCPPRTRPPPIPVPDREHHELAHHQVGAVVGLRERGAVGVVVHEDGQAEALLERRPQLDVLEPGVRAPAHPSGGEVEHRRKAHPDRLRLRRAHRLGHARDLRDQRLRARSRCRAHDSRLERVALERGHRHLRRAHVHANQLAGHVSPASARVASSARPRARRRTRPGRPARPAAARPAVPRRPPAASLAAASASGKEAAVSDAQLRSAASSVSE